MNTLDIRVRNMIILVLAVLAFFLLIQSVAAIVSMDRDENNMQQNMITVRGEGEAVGIPDIATFSFTVRTEAKDVSLAQQEMTKKTNDALEFLKQQGVDEKDIKTEMYNTNPVYDYLQPTNTISIYPTPGKQVISKYEASQTVSVKVRESGKAGQILTGISNLKVGEVGGLSYTVDDIDALKLEAKKKAIEKAKEEAKQIAESLGVDLDEIVGFYEEYPYDRPYGGDAMHTSVSSVKSEAAVPQLQPGERKVVMVVSLTYRIDN